MVKMKKIIASLLCLIIMFMPMSTICLAAETEENTETEVVEEIKLEDIKLNTRIKFKGKTYWTISCSRERGDYPEGKSAVVWALHKNKGVILTTYGYVKCEDIIEIEGKVISYDKETKTYRHDGDLIKIESTNNGVLRYEEGKIIAGIDGTTDIKLYDIKGNELLIIDAEVKGSEIVLNIPDGELSFKVEDSSVEIAKPDGEVIAKIHTNLDANVNVDIKDGGITLTATGNVDSGLDIKDKEVISIECSGNANATASLKNGLTASASGSAALNAADKEILKGDFQGTASATVNLNSGLKVSGSGSATVTLLEKIKAKLSGGANATVNGEGVNVSGNADASVNDTQIAAGDATANLKYNGDASLTANSSILGMNLPSFSRSGNLLEKIRELLK